MSELKVRFSASRNMVAATPTGQTDPPAAAANDERPPTREVKATPNAPIDAVAPRPARAASEGLNSRPCPACGVDIKTGYVVCPKCKYALDGKQSTRRAGGTAIASRTVPWTIVAILAALTLAIVMIAERDPATHLLSTYVHADGQPVVAAAVGDEEAEEAAEEEAAEEEAAEEDEGETEEPAAAE